jgi:hypothetical protein
MANNGAPAPRHETGNLHRAVRNVLGKVSRTSHFQCWFYPSQKSREWIAAQGGLRKVDYKGDRLEENLMYMCHEASLPGSSLATNEIKDDFTGVTERHAYRKIYEDRADFTFYVDDFGSDGGKSHVILQFFENWINSVVQESRDPVKDRPGADARNYFYRVAFPKYYQTDIYINKFEPGNKTHFVGSMGTYIEYKFCQAYPLAIAAMPVSYDQAQVLKCTVSFAYTRYIAERKYFGPLGKVKGLNIYNDPFSALNIFAGSEGENFGDSFNKFRDNINPALSNVPILNRLTR